MSQTNDTTLHIARAPQNSYHISFVSDWRSLKDITSFCTEFSEAADKGSVTSADFGKFKAKGPLATSSTAGRFQSCLTKTQLAHLDKVDLAKRIAGLSDSISDCSDRSVNVYVGPFWADHPEEEGIDSAIAIQVSTDVPSIASDIVKPNYGAVAE